MGCACAKEVVEIPPPSSHVPTPKQQQLQQQRLELNCTALILNHRSHILSEQIAGTDGAHPVATWVNQTKVDPRLDPAQFYLVSEPSSDKTPPRKQKGKSADAPTSNLLFDDEFDQLCSRSTNLTPVRPSSAHSDNFVAPREPESSDSRTPTVRLVCRIF